MFFVVSDPPDPRQCWFIALVHSGMARPFTLEVKLRLRDTLKNGIINEGGEMAKAKKGKKNTKELGNLPF